MKRKIGGIGILVSIACAIALFNRTGATSSSASFLRLEALFVACALSTVMLVVGKALSK